VAAKDYYFFSKIEFYLLRRLQCYGEIKCADKIEEINKNNKFGSKR